MSWHPDDPRLRGKSLGQTPFVRMMRRAAEGRARWEQRDKRLMRRRAEVELEVQRPAERAAKDPVEHSQMRSSGTRPLEPWRWKVMKAMLNGAGPHPRAVKPGQRAPGRRVPPAPQPVDSYQVLRVFFRTWRGEGGRCNRWRIRALAAIAVAKSLVKTTEAAMCAMRPRDVLALKLPVKAWKWVVRWLELRRRLHGPDSDDQPWLAYDRSNGVPRQISFIVSRTLFLAGVPGWRLGQLLRASWDDDLPCVLFSTVARNLVKRDSPLWPITLGRPFWAAG